MQAESLAHPNIALIKYWGKRDAGLNLPAVGSISITLDELSTRTRVEFDPDFATDKVTLDETSNPEETRRVIEFVDMFRKLAGTSTRVSVTSENNFPTGAGLASSASGFAALAVALNTALELELDERKLSELARRGSGSAARSLYGGFVEWKLGTRKDGRDSVAVPLLAATDWPLQVVIAITSRARKPVGSTHGMNLTMETSPYYRAWIDGQHADLDEARGAVKAKDFDKLATVSEFSCLKMHASAIAANPGIIYWNSATLACMQRVRELRKDGLPVFFTVDAGPQVKAICAPGFADKIANALSEIAGVERILRTGLGGGARVVTGRAA